MKRKRKIIPRIAQILILAALTILLPSCAFDTASDGFTVTATLFPQYDFARQIAGDYAQVKMLLPAGTESHSYEPSAADIAAISRSGLFLYTGAEMEPWAEAVIQALDDSVTVVNVSAGISLLEEASGHDGHSHGSYDAHIWTNPANAIQMTRTIADAFCTADPEHADIYAANAAAYIAALSALDADIAAIVENAKRDTLVFGGRFAMRYFTERYGLHYESAYLSCSADAEPSAADITRMIEYIRENEIPVLYCEEMSQNRVAKTISEETGAELLVLHSCHNVSKTDFDNGATYLSIMKQNAENLKKGLQ